MNRTLTSNILPHMSLHLTPFRPQEPLGASGAEPDVVFFFHTVWSEVVKFSNKVFNRLVSHCEYDV